LLQARQRYITRVSSSVKGNSMTTFGSRDDRPWKTVSPGVQFCFLRTHADTGVTALVRLEAGARVPLHEHPGGEETYMISGKLTLGDRTLQAGDYLWTPPGAPHDGVAEEAAELFLVLPGGIKNVPAEPA
jgi:quercetin dioxygenase-like cupin family protein